MQQIREQLEEIIHRVNPVTKEKGITDDSSLVSDLGLDSYDRFEIMMIAETHFGIAFYDDEEEITGKTFAQLVELVTTKIRARNAT
jgi:acyl carrier protein